MVHTKERTDDTTEEPHNLLKEGATFDYPDEHPDVITPAGLSAQRRWYLYDKIREFYPVTDRDLTCPLPSVPKPASHQGTPAPPSLPPPTLPTQTQPPLCLQSILLLPRDHALVHGARNQATTPGHALLEEDLLLHLLYNKTGSFKSHTTQRN